MPHRSFRVIDAWKVTSRIGFALLMLTQTAGAQTQGAVLRGLVTDSSSAALPDATLTLTNVEQGRSWTFSANAAGEYVFVQIPPGKYKLEVTAAGFKHYLRENLVLEVAQVMQLDIGMELGTVNETVEVTAQSPLLESASSTLGELVNSRTGEALPLNGRNMLQLVALAPGINTTRAYRNAQTGSGSFEAVAFSANGGRNVSNEVMLDGSPQVVMGYNQPAYIPSPDAVQEFRVQTNSLSAEYGRTSGAVVNIVHRSGTKEFHGVLYEFLRNDKLDANNFFSNRNGRARAPYRYNQFGFTLGGPLTPSRQTTFFFLNYEGLRIVTPGAAYFTVPTARMKAGDFTELANVIYDPRTIDAAGRRRPFPGNRIPNDRWNAVGSKLLSYYADPTVPGVSNNYFAQSADRNTGNNFSTKIDRSISARQNLFGRFSWHNLDGSSPGPFLNLASPNAGNVWRHNRSISLDDTYLAGGWVLHGNYGYVYSSLLTFAASDGFDLTTLGLPASMKAASQYAIFPRIEPAGYAELGPGANFISGNKFETHTWSGDATRLIRTHTIKFGGAFRLNRVSNFRPIAPAGIFQFNEGWTRESFNGTAGGDSIASMLLGYMSLGQIGQEPALALQVRYGAVYFQDDWRINARLSLNLGLRWDTDRPLTERYDRISWFEPNAQLPLNVPGLGPLRGGLVFAGRDGLRRGNRESDDNNFAPRVGLAYKLSQTLVFRSGFGIFYNPTTGIGPGSGNSGAISFNAATPVTTTVDSGRTPFADLSNPFPSGYNQPSNGKDGLLTFLGQNLPAILPYDRTPYSAQWNADLQYQLPGQMLIDIAYAGNAGVKLLASTQLNQLPDERLALGDELTQRVVNPFFGVVPATNPLGQQVTTRGQLLRPYPQFTGVSQTWGSLAHSSYHSLQAKFRKRYRNGLQMLAAYTWSKMLDDFSSTAGFLGQVNPGYTNNNRRDLDKSLSALDVAHRFTLNYQYDLPFRVQGWAGAFVRGWQISGVTTLQSGLPISINSQANTTGSLGGVQRPDSTGLASGTQGAARARIDAYLNPAAFVNAPRYTFGNVGRFLPNVRGPALSLWDVSVVRSFGLGEKSRRLDFRAEFFNLPNVVNLFPPTGLATDFGRPQFGTITEAERPRIIQFGLKLHF